MRHAGEVFARGEIKQSRNALVLVVADIFPHFEAIVLAADDFLPAIAIEIGEAAGPKIVGIGPNQRARKIAGSRRL
jgi:hypothetical protein